METETEEFEELIRMTDRVEADLLAAFLEDGEVRFKLIRNAQTMASLMPPSEVPVVFRVLKEDMPRARELLDRFVEDQHKRIDADQLPPELEDVWQKPPETTDWN